METLGTGVDYSWWTASNLNSYSKRYQVFVLRRLWQSCKKYPTPPEIMSLLEEAPYEELEQTRETYCEACKGYHWFHESGCYENCEGFITEFIGENSPLLVGGGM